MTTPVIQFQNFTFQYRTQAEPTLHNINLSIYKGEKVVIVGPSGSGKSTLAHCLNGLVPFSYRGTITGSLTVNGVETKDADLFSISKMVGTVLQDPDSQFIGLSVGEDIAFALENDCVEVEEMHERVKEVARMVDMESYLASGLHELSGGQKQRVALGGVLVDDAEILLFDEPLANLDPATGKQAISLIDRLHQETDKTIVIIEHRLEDVLFKPVDRIIVVDDGRIVADGTPQEILASDVLTEHHIREPLYVKALKYASGNKLETLRLGDIPDTVKADVRAWYERTPEVRKIALGDPVLELADVSFSYDGGSPLIKDVSFTIQKGEMVSIVGSNGAGKSTLSKLICGFEQGISGVIWLNGRDLAEDTIKMRANHIGMVMQNPNHMISQTLIFDEVALGLRARNVPEAEIAEQVEKTLKICGLYAFRNWPVQALSFGQKKRVTIASILVLEPEVIILDEPTAGQDFYHYTELMEFLQELNRMGITILMITHDMHLMLEYTTRTIVIDAGQKIADATPVEVLANVEVCEKAHLLPTSLFELAAEVGISDANDFVNRFIAYDKEVRNG
ncbi:ABC transporter ATP-binding protein [Sutcliffiella horikoshii]|uniref:ABC transporter ATP-binding protein n=1 Tax=Sutcliffiella horikoshii TaxID=79883 RepID=UPI00384AC896